MTNFFCPSQGDFPVGDYPIERPISRTTKPGHGRPKLSKMNLTLLLIPVAFIAGYILRAMLEASGRGTSCGVPEHPTSRPFVTRPLRGDDRCFEKGEL